MGVLSSCPLPVGSNLAKARVPRSRSITSCDSPDSGTVIAPWRPAGISKVGEDCGTPDFVGPAFRSSSDAKSISGSLCAASGTRDVFCFWRNLRALMNAPSSKDSDCGCALFAFSERETGQEGAAGKGKKSQSAKEDARQSVQKPNARQYALDTTRLTCNITGIWGDF